LSGQWLAYRGVVSGQRLTALASRQGVLADPAGIGTEQALAWLLRPLPAGATRRCTYGWDLECNLLLRDLPSPHVGRLLDGETVDWRGYRIEWIPGLLLHVWRPGEPGATLYDLAGWFRAELDRAVADYCGALPGMRRDGRAAALPAGRPAAESALALAADYCKMLELLADRLAEAAAGLDCAPPPARWYGPGALASSALRSSGARLHLKRHTPENTAPALWDAFSRGYHGGRIELLRVGGFSGPVWHYDINSAYGAGLARLPPLSFMWARVDPGRVQSLDCAVWRVRWRVADSDRHLPGPLPFRRRSGATYYPAAGEGWYWSPEVRAALEMYRPGTIDVLDGWATSSRRRSNVALLAERVYAERRSRRGQDALSDALLKLILPAVYGKLAQRRGRPAWSSLPAAAYVTSWTRAELLRASLHAPDAIIAYATDGLYSTERLPLRLGGGLGEWREERLSGATFIEPGIYRLTDVDGRQRHRSRGFMATSSEFAQIIAALDDGGPVALSRPTFVGHALVRILPSTYRQYLFHVLDLPFSVNPYASLRRVYDFYGDLSESYRFRPIRDWTTENRRSWQQVGGTGLSERYDVAGRSPNRWSAEADGARAVLLGPPGGSGR